LSFWKREHATTVPPCLLRERRSVQAEAHWHNCQLLPVLDGLSDYNAAFSVAQVCHEVQVRVHVAATGCEPLHKRLLCHATGFASRVRNSRSSGSQCCAVWLTGWLPIPSPHQGLKTLMVCQYWCAGGPVGVLAPVDILSACNAKVADTRWLKLL